MTTKTAPKTKASKSTKPTVKTEKSQEELRNPAAVLPRKPATIFVVTSGGEALKAATKLEHVSTYVETYNEMKREETPPAIIETIQWPTGPEWIVIEGDRVIYRGPSCADATALMDAKKLGPECLFESRRFLVELLRGMLTPQEA